MDFSSIVRKSAVMFRDNVVVTVDGRSQTYAELGDRAARLANGLLDLALVPGDRVAVLADNQVETLEQAAGIAVAGMVRSPMYVMNPASTHAYMLNMVGASACIVQDRYAADIESIRDQVPSLKHVLVVGDGYTGADTLDYEAVLAESAPGLPEIVVEPGADHIIRFSAGTTGKPKGIVHSQAGWLAMGNEFLLTMPRIVETDAWLIASPMSHAAGLMIWPTLAAGARYVIMPAFDPAEFLRTIERERITYTMVVPTMIQMLAGLPEAETCDLSSLRAVTYGAAPITEKGLRAAIEMWGNIMYQSFGQSEVLPGTTLAPEYHRTTGTDRDRRMLTSAGRPTPNTMVTICDEEGSILPVGETGEICIKTPGAMKGIWGDPEATAARFTEDGSVKTRDMGYLDEDGFLHLVDRKEDLVISGGFNVWPLEVENALSEHPDVVEAGVVGVPDEKWGEAVFAVVRLSAGSTVTQAELIEFARGKVGPVKRPKQLVIATEPLPKSVVGKLLRRQIREIYWTPSGQDS